MKTHTRTSLAAICTAFALSFALTATIASSASTPLFPNPLPLQR